MTEDVPVGRRGPEEEARGPARSVLPGAMLVGLLLVGAAFAAGYSLGDRGIGASADGGGAAILEAYERITRDYVGDVEPETLVGAAIGAMFGSLGDPYSAYMGADRFDEDLADVSGEFEGIGARLASEDASGAACEPLGGSCRLVVIDVLADSPAEASGLEPGDVIQAVDDKPVAGLRIADTIELVRGPSGTEVRLAIERDGAGIELAITRRLIRTEDVRSEVLADGRVGYLRVDTFSVGAAGDFHSRLRDHLDAGIEDLVIDLRDDPGGYVDAAVTLASEFLAEGTIFQEEHGSGERRVVTARGGGLATDPHIEVAVIIDGGTASASEIVAGALGVRDRATLVGTTTFGKATIQEWTELPGDNGGFRLSIARWLLPDGTSVDGVGVRPDIEVANAPASTPLEKDPVVAAAVEALLSDEDVQPASSPRPGASAGAGPSDGPAQTPLPTPAAPLPES